MRLTTNRRLAVAATGLMLAIGASGAAIAAGGDGDDGDLKRMAQHLASKDAFEAAVTKRLDVSADELAVAFSTAARTRIETAKDAGEITAAEADTLFEALSEGHPAHRIAKPADVAELLGVTEAQLRDAFAAEHKARLKARIDQAVKDGRLTQEQATEMKARIDAAELPADGGFGPGFGFGHHRHHGGFGGGPEGGLGPGPGLGGEGGMIAPAALA